MAPIEKRVHHDSAYQFIIGIALITAFILFYGDVLFSNVGTTSLSASLEAVTSTFGTLVAAVVAFYFGQRPTQTLAQQVQDLTGEREGFKTAATNALGTFRSTEQVVQTTQEQLETIKKMLGIE
ncbi:MAG: hypothetical protein HY247_05580 [archaeon]|nr:MAG: hypothetical protein HY247_05580 [archaeon]